MEDYSIHHVSPRVKRVIQSFQTASVRSLNGPNGIPLRTVGILGHQLLPKISVAEVEEYRKAVNSCKKRSGGKCVEYDNSFLAQPPFPLQQMPVFAPVDTTTSERTDTILEGETIAGFTVGGEKRLCLPQILNTVLRDFTLQQINSVFDDLHIFCSRCNPVQLETLKVLNILPSTAPSCGLITKTDAERLCSALLHANPERNMEPPSRNSFKVYHECFGKCNGVFNSDIYTSPDSKCICCIDCYGMFSPTKFVCHSHRSLEHRTCHWGFDSDNWRSYLLLSNDQSLDSSFKLQDAIEEVKSRFDPSHKQKRKQSPERPPRTETHIPKRLKPDSSSDPPSDTLTCSSTQATPWEALSSRQLSAFYPWSPYLISAMKEDKLQTSSAIMRDGRLAGILPSYLHTGPPVLLNPERVIPYSESERYERHFTPNVSLAPSSSQRTLSEDEDEDNDKPVPAHTSSNGRYSDSKYQKSPTTGSRLKGVHRDTLDYDVATDTDDSSLTSPTGSDSHCFGSHVYKSTLQQEMSMIRSLLEGKVDPSTEAHTHFLHEFSRLRAKTEEAIQWLFCVYKVLKQELASSQRQNLELGKLLSKAEKELKRLALEKEMALKDVRAQKEHLQAMNHNKFEMELESRRRSIESAYRKVCRENQSIRHELAVVADSSAAAAYADNSRSFRARLKMVLDLTPSQETDVNKQQATDVDSKKEQNITVD